MMIADQFLEWMESAPVNRRAEGADALVRTYLHSPLPELDRERLEAVMTVLLDDPAPRVRAAMAHALASEPDAPKHIVLGLAADQMSVAEPVLLRSPVLDDADLVDLVAVGPLARQRAVAQRGDVSRAVAAALAEVGEEDAVVDLLENAFASIAAFSVERIVERFGNDPSIRQLLLDRDDLPVRVREDLMQRLAAALRSLVTERAWMKPERAQTVVREACEKATLGFAVDLQMDDLDVLVEHLKVSNRLTPALLLRALCLGHFRFIEIALARLARLPVERVSDLLYSGRSASIETVCRQAHLPDKMIPAIVVGIETYLDDLISDEGMSEYARVRRMLERVLTRLEDIDRSDADALLAMLRRFASDAARDAARSDADAFASQRAA
ncbi:DUF2336 domain-containing protein [Coralliovum pocilloporae]|uniref:DUF2336 domain-containing protein n=1 Tax=Coralliovum pocilloporae TaxID=3066369 RepID=UPI0033070752